MPLCWFRIAHKNKVLLDVLMHYQYGQIHMRICESRVSEGAYISRKLNYYAPLKSS